MSSGRLAIVMIPAALISYSHFADSWFDLNALLIAGFHVFAIAVVFLLAAIAGRALFSWAGLIDSTDECSVDLLAAVVGMIYAFLIWAETSEKFYPDDRATRRDQLLDQAEEYLRGEGEPVTVSRLKYAMREIEELESEPPDDYE